jgi:hypothetical protein
MPNDASTTGFQSVLAPFMDQFLQEKHACGYAYHEPIRILHRLDDFLVQEGLTTLELPRSAGRTGWQRNHTKVRAPNSDGSPSFVSSRRSCCEPGIPPTFPTPHWLLVIHRPSYPEC